MSHANDTPDTPVPDVPPKVAPENVTLRSQPRPVTRLNRCMLAVLAGGLATAVLDRATRPAGARHRQPGSGAAAVSATFLSA